MKKIWAIIIFTVLVVPHAAHAQTIMNYGPGEKAGNQWGQLKLQEYIDSLPKNSKKGIEDRTIVGLPGGGARIFRLYKPSAPHYHVKSDAILYVVSGKGEYEVADGKTFTASPGTVMYWKAGTAHSLKKLIEAPHDILVFDVGVRDPDDIIFLDPKDEGSFELN